MKSSISEIMVFQILETQTSNKDDNGVKFLEKIFV